MTTEPHFDFDEIDELQSALDVLMVYKYLHKPSIPKTKGSPSIQELHAWATHKDNKTDFLKNMLPIARAEVRAARMGHKTEAEELHERKGITKLKEILSETVEHAIAEAGL